MEKVVRKRARVREVVSVYFKEAKKYPWTLVGFVSGSVLAQVAGLASPLYLRELLNVLASQVPTQATFTHALLIVSIVGLISLAGWAANRLMMWSAVLLESKVMRDLYRTAFQYLIRHSYDFFTSNFAGSLTHKVNKFSRAFESIIDTILMTFLPTFLYVAGAIVILSIHNLILGLALFVWSIIFLAFQVWMAAWRQPVRAARAEAETKQTGTISDAISNHMTILLFSSAKHEDERVRTVSGDWFNATLRSWIFDFNVWGILGFLMLGINVGLLFGAVFFWQRGLLTIGDFILIQSYLMGTINGLMNVNQSLRRWYDSFADAGEMIEVLKKPHDVVDMPNAGALVVSDGALAFSHVGFYFHSTNSIFKDFNLSIPPKQKIALVGRSGAGKTTITKVLLRLYDVNEGAITIDGQNIKEVTQDSLRDAIAFVPQEPVLFHRTLMENIRYGRHGATDEEVMEAAKKAHCHEFITRLPLGYETFVGERGIKLSGGERQRVAIARAILKNAPILVLDEATSSLDSQSEALIQDALATLMRGKTVIVIAHRLSTIMKMDRIIVLEEGKIVADGTHDELLAQEGLYQKLWNIQAGGFLADDENQGEEIKN